MLAEYLKTLQDVALLSPAEERGLWTEYRRGDVDSRLRLIEAYQPLVFKLVMQLRPPDRLLMDMLQEGTVGLIEAVERFDHERGVRFSTFAAYRIRGRVLNALRRDRPQAYSLDQDGWGTLALAGRLPDPDSEAALLAVEDDAVLVRLHQVIDTLPARERHILRAMFVESREPRRVAAELRISLSHLYRLQKQALAHLRRLVADDAPQPTGAAGY